MRSQENDRAGLATKEDEDETLLEEASVRDVVPGREQDDAMQLLHLPVDPGLVGLGNEWAAPTMPRNGSVRSATMVGG